MNEGHNYDVINLSWKIMFILIQFYAREYIYILPTRGEFLKNFASPSGDGRWFRNLGNFKNIIKNLGF